MAVSTADMNQIRVDVLGTTVDNPGATWTTAPPGSANRLTTTERIITRALNQLSNDSGGILSTVGAFGNRFNAVVGDEAFGQPDEAAFTSIGMNLIQAVAALVAGGGISPAVSFEFVFSDPVQTDDLVEVTVAQDCTIPADLAGAEYDGTPQSADMHFELTVEPAGDVIGEIEVAAGNVVTMIGIGGEVTAGSILRMTAVDIVGGSVSPSVSIKIVAERKAAPVTAGRFEHPQNVADTTWDITHGLGQRYVAVQVVKTDGTTVIGDVDYTSANECILTFTQPIAGTAVIRR